MRFLEKDDSVKRVKKGVSLKLKRTEIFSSLVSTDVSSVYARFKKNGQLGMRKVRGTRKKKNLSNCYEEKIRQIAWCVAKIEMKRGRKKLPWNLGQRVACLSLSLFSATEQWRTISRFFIDKKWIYRLFLLRSTH